MILMISKIVKIAYIGMKSEEIEFLPDGTGAVQVPCPVNLTQLLLQHVHDGLGRDVQS